MRGSASETRTGFSKSGLPPPPPATTTPTAESTSAAEPTPATPKPPIPQPPPLIPPHPAAPRRRRPRRLGRLHRLGPILHRHHDRRIRLRRHQPARPQVHQPLVPVRIPQPPRRRRHTPPVRPPRPALARITLAHRPTPCSFSFRPRPLLHARSCTSNRPRRPRPWRESLRVRSSGRTPTEPGMNTRRGDPRAKTRNPSPAPRPSTVECRPGYPP